MMNGCVLLHADCLIESDKIQSGSVDLILTDPPYGTMKGINNTTNGYGRKINDGHLWDDSIKPKQIFDISNRLLRKNGKLILFSQEPYTSKLTTEAIANLPFSYRMIWEKDNFANPLSSNKAPVNYYEDILVFSKNHDSEGLHPLREYFQKIFEYIGLSKKNIIEQIGQGADHVFRFNSSQFSLCTEETYKDIIRVFCIDKMKGFKNYEELKIQDAQFKSVFNLWEGNKCKSNILKYKKDYTGHHPTQKPVALLEDLIKTYSNEGDTVVDLTMGSGSTGVAAKRSNRLFIGIEREAGYFEIATERINSEGSQKQLFA